MAGHTQLLPSFPQKLGKYEILEQIGEGGYSRVYRGFDPLIKRPVAIKTCPAADAETRERFYREAQIAGNLDHPNIVTVYDLFLEDGAPYLVQELLGGDDLDVKIDRREVISFPEKLFQLLQIARGLEFAHSRGVIHRDVKPANVRVLEDGTAKILDFGIAKLVHFASDLTQAGMTVGTAAYLAPEQIRGEEATPETDIFSFGVLAYELLTYVRPFGRETISETFYQTLNRQPTAVTVHWAQCPDDLVEVINRCLRKDPSQRFGSCREVVRQLEHIRDRLRGEWSPAANPASTRVLPTDPDLMHADPVRASDDSSSDFAVEETRGHPPARSAAQQLHEDLAGSAGSRSTRTSQVDLPLRQRPTGMSIAGSTRKRRRRRIWPIALLLLLAAAGAAWRWLPNADVMTQAREALAAALEPDPPFPGVTAADSVDSTEPAAAGPPPVVPGPSTPSTEEDPSDPVEPPDATPEAATASGEETPEPAQAPPPPEPANLAFSRVWSQAIQVSIDGATPIALGRSRTIQLDPGPHSLTFSIDSQGFRATRSVRLEVEAGESRTLEVPIAPPGLVTVQAHLGAPQGLVSIDGGEPRPTPVRGVRLAPGSHRLSFFSRENTATPRIQSTIDVRTGHESVVTFDLDSAREPHGRERPVKR